LYDFHNYTLPSVTVNTVLIIFLLPLFSTPYFKDDEILIAYFQDKNNKYLFCCLNQTTYNTIKERLFSTCDSMQWQVSEFIVALSDGNCSQGFEQMWI